MADDLKLFPRGSIALDSGDLMDVTNVKVTQKRDVKTVDTLRATAAGIFIGHESTSLSFEAVCPSTGPERDYYAMLRTGKIKTFRIKIPGETFAVVGAVSQRVLDLPSDAPLKYNIEAVGKTVV
jgi:hypothetical protein